MQKYFVVVLTFALFLLVGYLLIGGFRKKDEAKDMLNTNIQVENPTDKESQIMKLTSPAFEDNGKIPAKYTCDGDNINPPLSFSDVPKEAKSLVLIVDDPDAPGGDWVHWLTWNISPGITQINEGETPKDAVQGTNDFGKQNYGGPCPPTDTHRYQFKLYALDNNLDLGTTTTKSELLGAMQSHILGQSTLTGLYSKK